MQKLEEIFHRFVDFFGCAVVNAFLSNSCNAIRALLRGLLEHGLVSWEYSCAAHPLNNFCEEIISLPEFKSGLRRGLSLSKGIKNKGMARKISRVLLLELYGKEYDMVLYSESRWSSVEYMFLRLKKVNLAITRLLSCVMNKKGEHDIDETYDLPSDMDAISIDPMLWKGVDRCIAVFDPIFKCLGILESNTSKMETAYAAFIYVYVHITKVVGEEDVRYHMMSKLLYRWNHIYSPVHALAFFCDPFFYNFCIRVGKVEGGAAIDIGKGKLKQKFRHALQIISRLEEYPKTAHTALLGSFMCHSVTEKQSVESPKIILAYQPATIWVQAHIAQNDVLASVLIKVYSGPGSYADVERQNKTGKRVHTAQRNHTGGGKVERQVAVE